MKRKIYLIITLALMLSTILNVTVSAASYPSLSSSVYCEFTAAKKMTVYVDSNFSKPGTSSPYKKYDAYISKKDVCYIYKITSSYAQVNYPTSSGRKTGYIKTKDLLGSNINPSNSFTASSKVTTLKYKNGATSGYYESGDKVYKISGTNYNVIYTAKSGKRAYKLAYVNLSSTPTTSNKTKNTMTNALYNINTTSSKISCGFDGYVNTSGRHEGIDFNYENGKSIYSLTNGVITNVVEGKDGGKLSTIAIYDSSNNKTVIYLHSNPSDSLYIGKQINKGDKIGTESWRGCSTSGSGHTHIEVRNGKKTSAAKSVGDYTLDNSNPKSYWNSLGYEVR